MGSEYVLQCLQPCSRLMIMIDDMHYLWTGGKRCLVGGPTRRYCQVGCVWYALCYKE
jgi:hypothetical protein